MMCTIRVRTSAENGDAFPICRERHCMLGARTFRVASAVLRSWGERQASRSDAGGEKEPKTDVCPFLVRQNVWRRGDRAPRWRIVGWPKTGSHVPPRTLRPSCSSQERSRCCGGSSGEQRGKYRLHETTARGPPGANAPLVRHQRLGVPGHGFRGAKLQPSGRRFRRSGSWTDLPSGARSQPEALLS